jgi:predicted Zn-dependent peptidase
MNELIGFTLNNGLKVYLCPFGGAQSVAIHLRGFAGSNYEQADEIGAAHFTEHYLLKGTEKYPRENDLTNLITRSGGKYIGITSRDDVLFGVHLLKDYLEDGMEFMSQIFTKPNFDRVHFLNLKSLISAEVSRYYDTPEKLISRVAHKIMFPNTRMTEFNTGSIEHIAKLKYENVIKFYNRAYCPENFILLIGGNINRKTAESCLKKFTDSGSRVFREKLKPPKLTPLKQTAYQYIKQPGLRQVYVRVDYGGFPYNNNNRTASLVAARYLNSVLNQQLKRDQGTVYKVNVDSFSSINFGGFSIFFAVPLDNLQSTAKVLSGAISRIKYEIDSNLLEQTKNSLTANLVFMLERTSLRAEFISECLLYQKEPVQNPYADHINKISAVTSRQVQNVFKQILSTAPKITLIGDISGACLKNALKTLQYIHV